MFPIKNITFAVLSGIVCIGSSVIMQKDMNSQSVFITEKGDCLKMGLAMGDTKPGYGNQGNSKPGYGNQGNSKPGYGNQGNSKPGYGNQGNSKPGSGNV
ncbi:MAG: hypothetical protein HQK54_07375 [Oligoflexales bacterium]|nr:hypothetical protein [Oligoflexales bacterium]